MFDSIFNVIIVLIPLAIFIGRAVSKAKGKSAPPPPPPRIPLAFEDDEEDSLLLIGKSRIAEITQIGEYSYPLDDDNYVMLFTK